MADLGSSASEAARGMVPEAATQFPEKKWLRPFHSRWWSEVSGVSNWSSADKDALGMLVSLAVACIVALLAVGLASWVVVTAWDKAPHEFGDAFGVVNAAVSFLAFAGMIVTLLMQRRELQLQRRELDETQQIMLQQKDLSRQAFIYEFDPWLTLQHLRSGPEAKSIQVNIQCELPGRIVSYRIDDEAPVQVGQDIEPWTLEPGVYRPMPDLVFVHKSDRPSSLEVYYQNRRGGLHSVLYDLGTADGTLGLRGRRLHPDGTDPIEVMASS